MKATLRGLRAVGLAPLMKINKKKSPILQGENLSPEWGGKMLLHHLLRDCESTGRMMMAAQHGDREMLLAAQGGSHQNQGISRGMRESEVSIRILTETGPLGDVSEICFDIFVKPLK